MNDRSQFAAAIQLAYPQIGQVRQLEPYQSNLGFSGAVVWRALADSGWYACKPLRTPVLADQAPYHHQILLACEDQQQSVLAIPLRRPVGRSWFHWQQADWELSLWRPGCADFNSTPTPARLQSAMAALQGFHRRAAQVSSIQGLSPAVEYRASQLAYWSNHLGVLASALQQHAAHPLIANGQRLFRALDTKVESLLPASQHWQAQHWKLQPILRDFWHDHALFTGEVLTGIIDLETIRCDLIVCDLVRFLDSLAWSGQTAWELGLEIYQAESAGALSAEELAIAPWLRRTGAVLGAIHWLQWLFVEQRQWDHWPSIRRRLDWLEHLLKQPG